MTPSRQGQAPLHELFVFPYDFDRFRPGFLASYIEKSRRLARTAPPVQWALRAATLTRRPRSPSPLGFLGTRFGALIDAVAGHNPAVLGTSGDLRFAWNRKLSYQPFQHIHREVYRLWQRDPRLESRAAAELIQRTAAAIRRSVSHWLVMENDSLFRQRFMVLSAREAGIRTLCIQDGLFQRRTPPETWHGHYADRMAVWGRRTHEQFVHAGYDPERLCILGYPHVINDGVRAAIPPRRVCILGQDWANYDPALERLKRQLLSSAAGHLRVAGFTVGYKPHPKEDSQAYLPAGAVPVQGDLDQALPRWDAFVALSSTALLDATLVGRIAVQIHHEDFHADHFDLLGYAYRIDHRDLSELPALLQTCSGGFPVPDEVVRTAPDLGKRFLTLLDSLD